MEKTMILSHFATLPPSTYLSKVGLDDLSTLEEQWYYFLKHAEEGRQEGRQEGAQQKSLDIARYFFLRGMPLAQIAEAVGVPETELESLLSVTSTLQLFSPTA